MEGHLIQTSEWNAIQEISEFLRIFAIASDKFSKSTEPSINEAE
jgi:hypothetical protein